MKATLEFDLADPDEARAHLTAVRAQAILSVVTELDSWLRSQIKYAKNGTDRRVHALIEARERLREEARGAGIEDLLD